MLNPLAQEMRFPWQIGTGSGANATNQKGWFTMALGTYEYLFPLGIQGQSNAAGYDVLTSGRKSHNRQLYPGGPSVSVKASTKTVYRTRVIASNTAKTEKKLILSERGIVDGSQATIYYTGKTYAAVAWLKAYANVAVGSGVAISGPKGQSYGVIGAAIQTPTV